MLFYLKTQLTSKSFLTKFPKSRQSYHIQFSLSPALFYLVPLKSIFYWSENIYKRHSCINNPLKSLEGFEILTKELAGTSYCRSSYGSRGKMCLSPIMNHTIQQQHCTSRPGLSPRQPDSKSLSLQMALRQNLWKTMCDNCLCVQCCFINKKYSNQEMCLALSCFHVYLCVREYKAELIAD